MLSTRLIQIDFWSTKVKRILTGTECVGIWMVCALTEGSVADAF